MNDEQVKQVISLLIKQRIYLDNHSIDLEGEEIPWKEAMNILLNNCSDWSDIPSWMIKYIRGE